MALPLIEASRTTGLFIYRGTSVDETTFGDHSLRAGGHGAAERGGSGNTARFRAPTSADAFAV